jgi:hypothetical protein
MATSPTHNRKVITDFLEALDVAPATPDFVGRANRLLELGVPIIPLQVKGKLPVTTHAAKDGTTDSDTVDRWMEEYPVDSNCGACAFMNGFWFVDDDMGTMAQTYKTATGLDLPETFTVKTSRGFHYYFRHDDASRAVKFGGKDNAVIDIPGYKGEARRNDQYVVGPGSVHPSGMVYEICNEAPIVAAPAELLKWLQTAFSLSETLKGKSEKMQNDRKSDSGFGKLFEAVGWKPIIDRLNAHSDARFHNPVLRPGALMYCPMPGHYKPADKDVLFSATPFGVIKDAPVVYCFGCGYSGDMVGMVYALDGGKEMYRNMYDCARAICKEAGLNFEEIFPPKAAEPQVEVAAPEAPPQQVEERPDMNRAVLAGRLGEMCERDMLEDFPVAYAWLALITAASVLVPERPSTGNGDNLHNLYTALVGPVNIGKSQAIEWALLMMRIRDDLKRYDEVKPGSAERLLKYMNRRAAADDLGPRVLMSLDEWKFFFDKAAIENSVFPTLLTTGFYRKNVTILDSFGRPLMVPASFSWIGGIVTESYDDCLSHVTSLGLHDRMLQGINPSNYAGFNYRPFEGQIIPADFEPQAVQIDKSVWECLKAWKKTNPLGTREAEIAFRVAEICASFDGAQTLYGKDLGPHLILADEQIKLRAILKPNVGETPDAQCAIKVENYLRAHGAAGEWIPVRTLMQGVHANRFGPNIFRRTLDGLNYLRVIDLGTLPAAAGNHAGGRTASAVRLVPE